MGRTGCSSAEIALVVRAAIKSAESTPLCRRELTPEEDCLAQQLVARCVLRLCEGTYRLSGGGEHPLEGNSDVLLEFVKECPNVTTQVAHQCLMRTLH